MLHDYPRSNKCNRNTSVRIIGMAMYHAINGTDDDSTRYNDRSPIDLTSQNKAALSTHAVSDMSVLMWYAYIKLLKTTSGRTELDKLNDKTQNTKRDWLISLSGRFANDFRCGITSVTGPSVGRRS